jgi:hypothetical protein
MFPVPILISELKWSVLIKGEPLALRAADLWQSHRLIVLGGILGPLRRQLDCRL